MTRRDSPLAAMRCRIAAMGVAAAMLGTSPAYATICKYVDADGATHYTNVPPDKGWRKISCDVADDSPRARAPSGTGGSSKTATPAGFPRVDADTQRTRDELRRKVLSDELASEEQLLGEARTAYGNGAPQPLADEQANAEKYRQRIGKLRQAVQLHERNVEALRKEIAALK